MSVVAVSSASADYRFDGIRFTIFDKQSAGLATNRLSVLFEDRRGDLWIGSENGGVTRYSGGHFTTYGTTDGLLDQRVIRIGEDDDGEVLIQTGLGIVRWGNGRLTPHTPRYPAPFTLGVDREELAELWYTTASSLHRFAFGGTETYTLQNGLASLDVVSVRADARGVLWVATRRAGLHRIAHGRVTIFGAQQGLPPGIHTAHICEDREGNIWIGTRSNGLYRVRNHPIVTYTPRDGLSHRNVYPMLEDRAGDIWIGTYGGGLNRYASGTFTRERTGGTSGVITALHEDADGRLWVVEDDVVLVRQKNGHFQTAYRDPSLRFQSIRAIYHDRHGDLWFGANNGLRRWRDGVVSVYTAKDGLAGNDVRVIHEDGAGTLWLGSDEGLTSMSGGRFTIHHDASGSPIDHVRTIHESADGALWIGTYDGGLRRMKDGRITRYTTAEGLFSNGVFQILEDDQGRFWMSSKAWPSWIPVRCPASWPRRR